MRSLVQATALICLVAICAIINPDQSAAQSKAAPAAATLCVPCHGLDGVGRDVEIPNLAGQHSIYLRNQLLAFKSGQRKHPEMRYVAREINDRELDELIVYYSTLLPN